MTRYPSLLRNLVPLACTLLPRLMDAWRFLHLYQEHQIKPHRTTQATRMVLTWLARWFDWRQTLTVVQPATLIRWHRQGFRLFWRVKSLYGRPPIPAYLRTLIRRMARDNPTWGEERIANELLLKLGLRVSPCTVRKYLPKRLDRGGCRGVSSQRWPCNIALVSAARAVVRDRPPIGGRRRSAPWAVRLCPESYAG
jgi:hypothetical protein